MSEEMQQTTYFVKKEFDKLKKEFKNLEEANREGFKESKDNIRMF